MYAGLMAANDDIRTVLIRLLNELAEGAGPDTGWVLNPRDPGLLRSLDRVTAQEASAVPSAHEASVAAHADHLQYGLSLLNRWSRGEPDPFTSADYSASWRRNTVDDSEWTERRAALRREILAWRDALTRPRDLDETELTGVVGSIAHLAYHLGAIRQISRSARGPRETET